MAELGLSQGDPPAQSPGPYGYEHEAVVDALSAVPGRLRDLTSGSLADAYESHLKAAVHDCLGERIGERIAEKVVPVKEWSSGGAVDVVSPALDGPQRPRFVMELKWCRSYDKVWEAVWDLFKVALLARLEEVQSACLVTGAPVEMWPRAFCGDIFDGGSFDPEQLCHRVFPRSIKQRSVWHYLLEGGYGHFPSAVPAPIETKQVGRWQVGNGGGTWEIRAVSVHPGSGEVPFSNGWPNGRVPESARRPAAVVAAEAPAELSEPLGAADYSPIPLSPRFDTAVSLARTLHFGHARKGTSTVYLSHLLAVCALVLEDGGDEDEAIAALLHDTVEDQGGRRRLDQIRQLFGDGVADIVEACSDTHVEPKPPWRQRKETYVEHLRQTNRYEVLRVSLADKLHNARAILADLREQGPELWSRFTTGSARDQLWYYGELAGVFEKRLPGRMAGELRRTVEALKRLNEVEEG